MPLTTQERAVGAGVKPPPPRLTLRCGARIVPMSEVELLPVRFTVVPVPSILKMMSSALAPLMPLMSAALVIEKLAPRFKSSGSTVNALKLVAYASTPVWVAGVFYLFLYLAPLAFVAVLYSIYLFYIGLPPMMKTHPENVVPYMVVSAIVLLVINIVLAGFRSLLGMPSFGL